VVIAAITGGASATITALAQELAVLLLAAFGMAMIIRAPFGQRRQRQRRQ
jgi:hypothetical protein